MSIYEEDYFNPELWLEYKSHSIAETLDHVVFNGVHLAEQNFLILGNLCGTYRTTSSAGPRLCSRGKRIIVRGYEDTKEE